MFDYIKHIHASIQRYLSIGKPAHLLESLFVTVCLIIYTQNIQNWTGIHSYIRINLETNKTRIPFS